MRWFTTGPWSILLGSGLTAHAQNTEVSPQMDFQIRDPGTGEVFFQGYEKQTDAGPTSRKETFFYDMTRKEVLVEEASYDRASLRMDSYVSRSALTGEETVLKTDGRSMSIRFRPEKDSSYKETRLEWTPETFHGKVFDDLIKRHWEQLLKGRTLKFDLVLPFRLESRGFQIFHNRRVTQNGQELEVFSLQPQNFLLRALVPKMEFFYAAAPAPQLRIFAGPSVLPIRGETNRPVEIIYGLSGARS